MLSSQYENMLSFVQQQLASRTLSNNELRYPFRDRFAHTLRVLRLALHIQEKEGGDREILAIAAIFHDVCKGVSSHAEAGAVLCDKYLRERGYPTECCERVYEAIRYHSHKADDAPSHIGLEAKILIDADTLDEVGALTVLWDGIATGMEPQPCYERVYERLLKELPKLQRQSAHLITEEGKRLYRERLTLVENFIENLRFELGK